MAVGRRAAVHFDRVSDSRTRMEGRMKGLVCFVLLFFATGAQASEGQLKEGNRLFWNGHYEDALKKYNDALIDSPESPILRFNAAGASYQMGDFASSEKQFKEAGDRTPIPALRSAARYNQGNAAFRQNNWKD